VTLDKKICKEDKTENTQKSRGKYTSTDKQYANCSKRYLQRDEYFVIRHRNGYNHITLSALGNYSSNMKVTFYTK
jgi:hypothetical protein